jgi:twitching motility protein PilT
MRDLETIEIAIETAETGHLVFGTVHTNTAPSTIDRIIDAFPSNRQNQIRTMLADSLKAAISQTLCKKVDRGRVAALEILLVDRGISAMIRDGKTFQIPSAMQVGGAAGMILLNDSLLNLVVQGIIDSTEAYIKAVDKTDMLTKFKKAGIPPPDIGAETAFAGDAADTR